ncbi:hypothetical protein [Parendozoicomonas haliclonae]|uniref:DUF600 family protein n=1 Tax=Parendozoicomonas haliclonae TaxID=1960125 RepID=A0A1X7ARB6_9GAMM|nr:hypothetical protein [Parendozoicomonas haliclonae]SMA50639.1 hypothetical protein EHSB41UT_04456 [Parendozoicomonas haliclonae]
MTKNIENIYQTLGQNLYDCLPEIWDKASILFCVYDIDVRNTIGVSFENGNTSNNTRMSIPASSECISCFKQLYVTMQKDDSDIPWNKAYFELLPDGEFDLQFKLDDDFAWLNQTDRNSPEYSSLDGKTILQIKTWDGLAPNTPRPWLKS